MMARYLHITQQVVMPDRFVFAHDIKGYESQMREGSKNTACIWSTKIAFERYTIVTDKVKSRELVRTYLRGKNHFYMLLRYYAN